MAMPYATDSDLQNLIPGILDQGVASFATQLGFASTDVLNLIKSDWWPKAVVRRFGAIETVDIGPLFPPLDEARINEAVLINLTCYRALSHYIIPMLTKDNKDDSWAKKIGRYEIFYGEEWELVAQLPLYDFDGDSQFSDKERRGVMPRRLIRQ